VGSGVSRAPSVLQRRCGAVPVGYPLCRPPAAAEATEHGRPGRSWPRTGCPSRLGSSQSLGNLHGVRSPGGGTRSASGPVPGLGDTAVIPVLSMSRGAPPGTRRTSCRSGALRVHRPACDGDPRRALDLYRECGGPVDACGVRQAELAPRIGARADIDNLARPPRDLTPNP